MPHSQQFLPVMPLEKLTQGFASEAKSNVTPRQSVTWNEIPETAFDRARLERKSVAVDMGKSHSWFCRALKGIEKLGWNDLGIIQDKTFWQEVVEMICAAHGIAPGMSAQDEEDRRIGKAYRELHALTARSLPR